MVNVHGILTAHEKVIYLTFNTVINWIYVPSTSIHWPYLIYSIICFCYSCLGKKGDYLKLQATLECKLNVTLLYKFSPVGSVTIPMQLLLLQQLPFIVEYPILMPTYNTHSSLFLDGKEVGRKESSADLIFAYRF